MLLASATGLYLPECVDCNVGQIKTDLTNDLSFLEEVSTFCKPPGNAI